MQAKLIWSNNDYSETWTISWAAREQGPASPYRQSAPGQGCEDKIRTFLSDIVPGSARCKAVPVRSVANGPIMHLSWPTEKTVFSALADYCLCVRRAAKISLCVRAAFILTHVQTHTFMSMEREVCKCGFMATKRLRLSSKTKGPAMDQWTKSWIAFLLRRPLQVIFCTWFLQTMTWPETGVILCSCYF